ncbi:unnamed protein product, partial [Prunus brigantina]
LAAQISRPGAPGRGDVRLTRESYFWIRCVLCAGVPARSTVRRGFGRVWWWCRWWILGGAPVRCSRSDSRMIYGVSEAITRVVLRCLEKSRVV